MTEDKLTALFDSARESPLETSVSDVNNWIAPVAIGLGFAAAIKVFLIEKWIIMTSIFVSITGLSVFTFFALNTKTVQHEMPRKQSVIHTQKFKSPLKIESIDKSVESPLRIYSENKIADLIEKDTAILLNDENGIIQIDSNRITKPFAHQNIPIIIDSQSFTRIDANGFIAFTVVQGSNCSVSTTLDSTEVVFDIEDGKLEITGMNEKDPGAIIITVVNLQKVELSGFSKMEMQSELNANELEIEIDGISSCRILGVVNILDVEVSGQSSFYFNGKCSKADLEISGMSSGNIAMISSDLELEISGQSTVKMSGSVVKIDAEVSGDSELKAKECVAETMDIEVTGTSDAVVNVTKLLDAAVSGKSNLNYYGSPTEVKENTSGLSSIKAKK